MKKIWSVLFSTVGLYLLITVPLLARADSGIYIAPVIAGVLPQNTNLTYQGIQLSAKGSIGYGFGALLEARLIPLLGIEAGAIFLQRNYTLTGQFLSMPFTVDSNTQALHLPVGLRVHLGSFISLEAGGYFDVSQTTDSSSNYGLQGGARFSIPFMKNLAFFAEARHNRGFKDYGGYKASDLALALVGIAIGGDGK